MAEERDPDLNEKEDIKLDKIREDHWGVSLSKTMVRRIFMPCGGRYILKRSRS